MAFKEHMGLNIAKIREDFPIYSVPSKKQVHYLDSACMSLKPRQVIEKQDEYLKEYPACAGRSHHALGERATTEV
jgi:cysteine desulfurase/selenocysteine lyase